MDSAIKNITLIGAGQLGYHLGKVLAENGIKVRQVFSRQKIKARKLADAIGTQPLSKLSDIDQHSDLYIIAVRDDAIREVAESLGSVLPPDKLLVHTSGASPSTILAAHFTQFGVFYPLQTFSISKVPDFNRIPIGVYSSSASAENQLFELAGKLSNLPYRLDDQQRADLHLAAVFVNNFTNFLFTIGHELTSKKDLPFEILLPLIEETVDKIKSHAPSDMQTGPARRNDQATIARHLKQLKEYPDYQHLYQLFSSQISDFYHKP